MKTTRGERRSSTPLSLHQIRRKLSDDNLDELLELWWAEQGDAKKRDLELIAAALPFSPRKRLRVLDLCCGPGDVGRAIRSRFPKSCIDCVDRDVFLLSICIGVNRREGIPGLALVRDLRSKAWSRGLSREYDVVATANALHWFHPQRAAELFREVFQRLRPGGVFLFAEPACVEKPLAAGVAAWKSRQPARYSRENWQRFWSRANELLGYDHTKQLGPRDARRIGDKRMSVLGWIQLLKNSGFESIDVLLRDADGVILAGAKPGKSSPRSRLLAGAAQQPAVAATVAGGFDDRRDFRRALGQFATGVTVVTTRAADGRRLGITVNSFASVSLDPPLVLWSLARQATNFREFTAASHFAVNVLKATQHHLSHRFATPTDDKFKGVDCEDGPGGLPLLAGTSARFICRTVQQYDGGDHVILLGEVESYSWSEAEPLVFHSGRYRVATRHPEVAE